MKKSQQVTLVIVTLINAFIVLPSAKSVEIAPFTTIYSRNLNGNFVMTGNTLQTCTSTLGSNAGQCRGARNFGVGLSHNNDDYVMRNLKGSLANIDSVNLFSASSAQIQLPRGSIVQQAFLSWFGTLETPTEAEFGLPPTDPNLKNKVLFARPSQDCAGTKLSQCSVSGTVFTESLGGDAEGFYSGFADITSRLTDSSRMQWTEIGDIQSAIVSVGNVQSAQGIGASAGWSVTVVYSHPNDEIRHIDVKAGFGFVAPRSSLQINLSGISLPQSGDSETSIGVFGADGDTQTIGDSLTLGSGSSTTVISDNANPANNMMNSSVSQNGAQSSFLNGAYVGRSTNTFGVDVDRFDVVNALPKTATSARASFTTTNDNYYISTLILATPVAGAELQVTKYISQITQGGTGSNSTVTSGDIIEYTVAIENVGTGTAKSISIRDDLDSVHLGNPSTTSAGCNIVGNRFTCANLGNLNPFDPAILITVTGTVLSGSGSISNYAVGSFGGQADVVSNVVTVDYGKNPVDLGLNLQVDPDFVQAGEQSSLAIELVNYGPADESNPTVKVKIPTGLSPVGGWPANCSMSKLILTCSAQAFGISNVTQLKPGQNAQINIVLKTSAGASMYVIDGDVTTGSLDGDPNLDNNTAQVELEANHAPVARNTAIKAVQNGPRVLFDIAPLITDRDGDALRLSYVSPSQVYGSVRLSATTFSFQPNTSWHGVFKFKYRVNDGRGGIDEAWITVTVSPAHDASSGGGSAHNCRGFIRFGC